MPFVFQILDPYDVTLSEFEVSSFFLYVSNGWRGLGEGVGDPL